MTSADNPHMDYFHFTYEGISSESDETSNSRRNSTLYADENTVSNGTFKNLTLNSAESDDGVSSVSTSANSVALTPYARAVRAVDWRTSTTVYL